MGVPPREFFHQHLICWAVAPNGCWVRVIKNAYNSPKFEDDFQAEYLDPKLKPGTGWWPLPARVRTADEAQAEAESYVGHLIQADFLPRRTFQRTGAAVRAGTLNMQTPWGIADHARDYDTMHPLTIVLYSTPSHGGFRVAEERLPEMPEQFRGPTAYSPHGWFEEDCDWARVALSFPSLFTQRELRDAQQTWDRTQERAAKRAAGGGR